MSRFSEQFIQQVAQATDIVDLVSQYVSLKKKGREFVGLCPFHDDKNPSMYVVPAKQMFHCFVCQTGGGVFQWLMKYESLSFPEAVEMLAERANIPLPTDRQAAPTPEGMSRNELRMLAKFAARWFRSQLFTEAGSHALEYARGRELSDESIKRFGLGFAPDAWDALVSAARKQGWRDRQLVAAGLAAERQSGSGVYDRFRNRLIFPILDTQGHVIAFGGRALADDESAKYLNSPEGPLFDKSSNLYALNWAREGIVKSGRAVVVEGYLDALIPLQAGVDNVVATLGTALTDQHVRLLSRFAAEAVLIFDADTAGQAAAERAMEVFLAQRLSVRVATVPAGKDPCDFVLAEGADALGSLVDEAPDALAFVWSRRQEAYKAAGGNLADGRRVVEDFLRLVVSGAAYGAIDEVRRGQLAQHIGHMLNIAPGDLQQQMRRLARQTTRRSGRTDADESSPGAAAVMPLAERNVLEVLLNEPGLFETAAERIGPEDFTDERLVPIAEAVWALGLDGRLSFDELINREGVAERASLVSQLAMAGSQRGNHVVTLNGAVGDLCYRRERRELEQIKQNGLDDDALRRLHERLKDPDARRHPRIS